MNALNFLNSLLIISLLSLFLQGQYVYSANKIPEYRVVLSPGHGGKDEYGRKQTGECWYYPSSKFLRGYSSGTRYKKETEEKIVLNIARKVLSILDLTRTEKGWKIFKGILEKVSDQKNFKRVKFNTLLVRDHSVKELEKKQKTGDYNKYFRMFDSPLKYTSTGAKGIYYGRLSRINRFLPHLVVPMHLNTSGSKSWRGMHTVIVPPFSIFDSIKKAWKESGEQGVATLKNPWMNIWNNSSSARSRAAWAANDCSTYFSGRRLNKKATAYANTFLGIRNMMLTWTFNSFPGYVSGNPEKNKKSWPTTPLKKTSPFSYNLSKPFLYRENTRFEKLRREKGPCGFGGHNHYAGSEIIKFTRLWLYKCMKDQFIKKKGTTKKYTSCLKTLGPILKPAVSDWSEPLFTNGVTGYLELGLLSNKKDRFLIKSYPKRYAQGIAIGIYSLFADLTPKKIKGVKLLPTGKSINWTDYKLNDNEKRKISDFILKVFKTKKSKKAIFDSLDSWFDCTWLKP